MARRTLETLISRLSDLEKDLQSKAPSILMSSGKAFLEAKKRQILSSGVGRYSSKKFYPSALKGKELTSSGRSFIEEKIKSKTKINWASLRKAEGLQTSYVDLYYSGHMWNSTIAKKANSSTYVFYITIGAKNKLAQKKLNYNFERYGDFLSPNKSQLDVIKKELKNNVSNLIIRRLK